MPLIPVSFPSPLNLDFRFPTELIKREDIVLPQLYEWHAKENPNFPVFVFRDGDKLEYITYHTANRAIDRAARFAAFSMGLGTEDGSNKPVVGVLANTETFTFTCTVVGLLKAGCVAFLISTRNSAAGVANMAQKTGMKHLISSSDTVVKDVAKNAVAILASAGIQVSEHTMPVFDDLFGDNVDRNSPFAADVVFPTSYESGSYGVIMHSSGSTGHPKPIGWTQERILRAGKQLLSSGADWRRSVVACHGTPMFHGLGCFSYSIAPILGSIVASFKPASPPPIPTPDAVWEGIVKTQSDFTWLVPSFIEEWAHDPAKVQCMKKMRAILFGGAALNEKVGNALADQGVTVCPLYGSTEVGAINDFGKPRGGKDWAYWSVFQGTQCAFRPLEEGRFELVVLSPPEMPLPVTNTKVGDLEGYATSDVVVPHPTQPGRWKIVGRADEQIILSNGEKTNPIPLERMINEDPHVKCAIVFGQGRFQNGVLIEPAPEHAIDPSDVKQLEAFRTLIWPTIKRVNDFAPQQSRIFKEMILVTSPSRPFLLNVKNLPRRGIILKEYHAEIQKLYEDVESSAQSEIDAPTVWDAERTIAFVRTVVENTLRRAVPDDADIFRSGGDSLQATWIRNTILRAIRETNEDAAKRLPTNLVFAAPTIAALADVVLGVVNDTDGSSHTPDDLWKYVERYSADLPARPPHLVDHPADGKDVVVITGTTGGFGCDTLEHLLRDESVDRVYAFNRKDARAMERQRAQFRARGLEECLLDSPKFRMIEVVLHEPGFGLEPLILDEIRRSVTHIMHNAWKVNFNFSLPTFQVDIQGARNLVDLALGSPFTKPPSIVFVSSIGTLANYKISPIVPEIPIDDPAVPFGSGYSESKWVTEHMLQNVAERTSVHTVVVRLGQVAGDRLGYWNETEWFPATVKTALFQGCLPDVEGVVSWFPAYEAAKAFTEMRRSSHPVLHLVHPRPVSWRTVMAPIAEALHVPLVPYQQWFAALEESARAAAGTASEVDAMKENPALRLLPFFSQYADQGGDDAEAAEGEAMGLARLATERAAEVSQALGGMPRLDAERARRWVAAWKKAGFL